MTELIPAERPHAKHSPSSLHYKEICPGFKNRSDSSPASEEGQRLHHALETGDVASLDEEQLQVVAMCRDYVSDLEAEARPFGVLLNFRELRLSIANGLTFGTADYIAITRHGREADLVDFKFGRNSVPDAEVNAQMQAYALAVFERFDEVEQVRVHILLPRRDEVSVATYHRSDVLKIRLRIETIIARCEAPTPDVRPTENCLWCAQQATCPALHRHALSVANAYDGDLQLPDELHPSHIIDPSVMGRALLVTRVMEKWCDSVKHHALQMRLNGQEIPGHELRTRAGIRKVSDPLAAWVAVKERISPEQFVACCDVSLPKLENLFAEAAPRGGKTKAKQELSEALADLGIVESTKESVYLAKTRK